MPKKKKPVKSAWTKAHYGKIKASGKRKALARNAMRGSTTKRR